MDAAHARLLKEIEAEARVTAEHTGIAVFDERTMRAMAEVSRHEFVPTEDRDSAYLDLPLSIGLGQTISQPYMVGRMTELLLAAGPLDKVLEIGTGSGYQTSVLAQLVERVFSVERIQALQDRARHRQGR